jgi:hypothetical protein
MASKLLMSNSTSTLSSASRSVDTGKRLNRSSSSSDRGRTLELMKSLYQTDQQVKFLHLEAEVETLLLELRTLKQQSGISEVEK